MEVLRPWQYRWFPVSDDLPFSEVDSIRGDPSYHNLMWLFAPEPPGQQFWDLVAAWRNELTSCGPVISGAARQRSGRRLVKLIRYPFRGARTLPSHANRP
jgi:hypothetical protein